MLLVQTWFLWELGVSKSLVQAFVPREMGNSRKGKVKMGTTRLSEYVKEEKQINADNRMGCG